MKRVQVRPGKFVSVSSAVAEKAARAFATVAFSRHQIDNMAAAENLVRGQGGVLLGGLKPVRRSKPTVVGQRPPKSAPRGHSGVGVYGRDGRILSGDSVPIPKRKAA